MKKYISYLLTLALLVPAFVSCTQERDFLSRKQKTHTVHFATSDPATRTGLTIEDNMVKPDWRETDLENIHFFEIDATNAAAPGTADEISLSDDNRTAHFKAAISDEIIINVPTSSDAAASGTSGAKGTGVSPYTFAAVVAQMPDKDAFTFVIPSEQHPDAETLKDPNAEFLVGYSRKSYDAQYDYDSDFVDLYFDRVAALGRLAISGFVGTGEKVKSVTITATGGMTGKATYPGDFTLGDKNKVNFTKVDEPLVLNYGDGVAVPVEDPFYAYFVAAPGEATVTSIEVLTDQYKYTKTVSQGAKFTFSDEQLLNIDFDLLTAEAEDVAVDNNTWYKASMLEAGYDYIIVSGDKAMKNNGNEQKITAIDVAVDNNTISPENLNGIVWTASKTSDINETLVANGRFVLTNKYSEEETDYLWRESDGNGHFSIKSNSGTLTKYMAWEYDGQYFWNISTTQGTSPYYVYYSDDDWASSTTATETILFTNRPPIEVSFASAEAKYDLDNKEWTVAIPELTAPEGAAVTYSSSNEDIATVAADGTVTPKAAGSVRITATVAGNDEHQGGSAYYDLTVTTSKITTWYKVEEFVPGQTYLLVSHGYTLSNDNGSIAAYNAEINSDEIQFNAPSTMVWTAEADGNYCNLANNGKYLIYQSSTSSGDIKIGDKSSTPDYNRWSYSVSEDRIVLIAQSRTLYWSDSRENWNVSSNTGGKYVSSIYTNIKPLKSRNLAFSKESITVVLGQTPEKPELSGMTEGISYSSFDTSIATVDGEGNVTPQKVGTTTITASADATDEYAAGSASYKLTVSDGSVVFFVKVTELSELNTSDTFIITNTADNNAFKAVLDGSTILAGAGNTKAFTLTSDGKIVDDGTFEACKFTLEEKGTKYNMYFSGVERYIYPSGSSGLSNKVISESPSADQAIAFSVSGGNWTLDRTYNNGSRYFVYNTPGSGDPYFQTSATSSTLHLFKLEGSGGDTPPTPEKQERNLSFGTSSFSCTLGEAATFPTLSGAADGVTYSSSNESVATVSTTGVVTAKAAGTTIIKAEASESDTYLAGSAQYTLTVNPAAGDMITVQLKKATSLSTGKKYVLVSNGYALLRNGDSAGAVTFSSNSVTIPSTSQANLEWTLGTNTDSNNRGNIYDFSNGGYYFGVTMNTTQTPYTYTVQLSQNKQVATNLTIQNHNVELANGYIFYKGNSSSQFIYYDTASGVWKNHQESNGTFVESYKTTLYVVDDGSGDDPTPVTATYYLASSIEAGKEYVIVSNDKALLNDSGNAGSTDVTVSDGAITVIMDNAILWKAEADGTTFNFVNNGQYLRRNTSNTGNIGIGAKSSTARNNQWSYNSTSHQLSVQTSSSTAYLGYDSSWTIGNSGNVILYTTEPGSSPGGGDEPSTTKTYTKVSSISAGTYLIGGTETNGGTYICTFPPKNNVCAHLSIGSSSSISSISSNDYTAYEVELIASGSNWLVKLKSTGEYMYTSGGEISFTANESEAKAHSIGSTQMTCTSGTTTYYFYHSGSSQGFKYRNSSTTNLCFYKLSE